VTAAAQTKITAKPMNLGFGRAAAAHPASKVTSGRYAASVRAAIDRPAARGGGRATVVFSIGPAGGLQGVRIARSSGKAKLDQAAIATVQSAAPFPPPPAGVNPTFSIQIYFH
jgi:protein TonB